MWIWIDNISVVTGSCGRSDLARLRTPVSLSRVWQNRWAANAHTASRLLYLRHSTQMTLMSICFNGREAEFYNKSVPVCLSSSVTLTVCLSEGFYENESVTEDWHLLSKKEIKKRREWWISERPFTGVWGDKVWRTVLVKYFIRFGVLAPCVGVFGRVTGRVFFGGNGIGGVCKT